MTEDRSSKPSSVEKQPDDAPDQSASTSHSPQPPQSPNKPTNNPPAAPSALWYVLALIIFVVGMAFAATSFVHHMDAASSSVDITQVAPSSHHYGDEFNITIRPNAFFSIIKGGATSFFIMVLTIAVSCAIAINTFFKRRSLPSKEDVPAESGVTTDNEENRVWATLCHLSAFLGYLIPFANVFAPFIIWMIKRKDSAFVNHNGKEAINFQLSLLVYYLVGLVLVMIFIGVFLLTLLTLFNVIAVIIASVESANGKTFRYPLAIRFLR